MILAAVAALVFLSALTIGVNDAMVRNSVSLYTGHISGFELPSRIHPSRLEVHGVAAVLRRFHQYGIMLSNARMTTVSLIGIDPDEEKKTTALWKKTIAGRYLVADEASVYLSSAVAEHLAAKAGDTVLFKLHVTAPASIFAVAGIYKTGLEQLDHGMAFCPVKSMPGAPETCSVAIFLKDGVNPASVVAQYAATENGHLRFKTWEALMPDLRQLIDLNYVSMAIVMVLVFGVVSLGISCAFVIFIIKNLREYGIMKAMGVTPGETTLLITAEVVLMCFAAASVGILAGIFSVALVRRTGIDLTAFTSHNRYFAVSGVIYPRLTPFSIWVPPALALVSSLIAALWPAGVVIRKKAAEILRGS